MIFKQIIEKKLNVTVEMEHRFCSRRWRFDYAIPEHKIAIEIEGGAWTQGRHTRGKGFINDMEKYNKAVELGWRLLRYVPSQKLMTSTIEQIMSVINIDSK